MVDHADNLSGSIGKTEEESLKVAERIFAASQPGAVFGEPVKSGDYTVITATEVGAGGGFGFGHGIGGANPGEGAPGAAGQQQSSGGGGGGGGGSMGRPVAIIVIGPNGVEIKPIVDVTKLGIAGITTGVAMLATLRKIFG